MDSYNTLILLAEVHRGDMLREAQPKLRSVMPKRERVASIRALARAGWPGRRLRFASAAAIESPLDAL